MKNVSFKHSLAPVAVFLFTFGVVACGGDADSGASAGAARPSAEGTIAGIPEGTDIWIFQRYDVVGGGVTFEDPRNVTSRIGYDNQPNFTPDGQMLFTQGEGERTDLWRWTPADGVRHRLTLTMDESEYSATPIPASSGGVSYIKVEADSTQRLWRIEMDGTGERALLENVAPVGYHAWLDGQTVALFVLGNEAEGTPSTLQIAEFPAGPGQASKLSGAPEPQVRTVAENIGRSMQSIPGRNAVSFTQPREGGAGAGGASADGVGAWTLMEYDLDSGRISRITDLPDGTQDHAWDPDGGLVTVVGGEFMMWQDGEWVVIADWSRLGQNFTRLALSPEGRRVAVVGEPTGAAGGS